MVGVISAGSDFSAGPKRSRRRRWWWWALVVVLLPLLASLCMHEHVRWSAAPFVVTAAMAPAADCIVVPGARIHADGTPYHLLVDRLATAAELFAAGKAPCIVISGRGDAGLAEDEVAAMRRWLEQHGVPRDRLVDDPKGLRTLATMQRWPLVSGARSALVVSNPFHVERAVFLGRAGGLEVVGVAAPYGRTYSRGTRWRNQGREVLARVLAWCDVHLFGACTDATMGSGR